MRCLHPLGRYTLHVRLVDQIPRPKRRMPVEPGHRGANLGRVEMVTGARSRRGQYTDAIGLCRVEKPATRRAGDKTEPGIGDLGEIRLAAHRVQSDGVGAWPRHAATGGAKRHHRGGEQAKRLAKLKSANHRAAIEGQAAWPGNRKRAGADRAAAAFDMPLDSFISPRQTIWTFFSHLISNRLQPKIHISK